jgi:hypothetical protein
MLRRLHPSFHLLWLLGPLSLSAPAAAQDIVAADALFKRGVADMAAKAAPSLAEHGRPKDVASTPPPGATTAPRTSLGAGIVPQPYARIDWASLLRRVFLEDVLACPCGGRRRILSDVTDPTAIVAILEHLDLPARAPPLAAARDPGWFDAA